MDALWLRGVVYFLAILGVGSLMFSTWFLLKCIEALRSGIKKNKMVQEYMLKKEEFKK